MDNSQNTIEELNRKLTEKETEIRKLKSLLSQKGTFPKATTQQDLNENHLNNPPLHTKAKLNNEEIARYSRQLILPEIGVKGQLSLSSKSALIVGAGRLGIVDYDEVEINNLHRQILHTESRVGVTKAASVAESCQQLNSHVKFTPYHLQLDSSNALQIISQYDVVLDATDNVATRYLLNDACVIANKPLVSGSALRFEGQLTVYHHKGSPCYRCLYPKPPPPETVTNCSDGGVLGVIPGIIGCLQALEAIKIAAGIECILFKNYNNAKYLINF
ncbi:hypothetical protein KUTeg_013354 [Tegillarca granosa]|uniref:THIF-type NAD/FAD binding fold domain-containing protein n=1 Tax=Tegillarca granosa TaxID=220873 RepID=A0ABQ9ETI8_TEGGR|nr:hypothetical protein KUTeg_013354 [Tegillarca granosa]